jgi:hypothetical protein
MKNSATTAFGRLDVKDGDPAEVSAFGIRALPAGTTSADMKIDSAEQARAIDGAIGALLLDAEFQVPRVALLDAQQVEPPGLIAEAQSGIESQGRLIFGDHELDSLRDRRY